MPDRPKQKLLVIAPQNPYPATDGGKIGIYYPVVNLAKYFNVHFVFTHYKQLPHDIEKHFAAIGVKIYPQYVDAQDKPLGILLNIFSRLPYKFQKYCKRRVLSNIKAIAEKEAIQLVWCNHSHMAWYGLELKKRLNVKVFLREHNVEYSLVEQMLSIKTNPLVKAFINIQLRKTRSFELDCWKSFDKTYLISDSDMKKAKRDCPGCARLDILYDSFQLTNVSRNNKAPEPFSFVYTGNLDTFQNLHNFKSFVNNIWTQFVEKDGRWKLYVTGNSDETVKKHIHYNLRSLNIINAGFVEHIDCFIRSKKYFVSPTYIGAGVRIKVLNAMATGAVCFATHTDVEMLDILKDMDNIVSYKDFGEFYKKLFIIENDNSLYQSISLRSSGISEHFSWDVYAAKVSNDLVG